MPDPFSRALRPIALLCAAALAAGCAHHTPPQVAAAPAPAHPKHTTAWEDSVVLAQMARDAKAHEAQMAAEAKALADAQQQLARLTYFDFDRAALPDSDKARLDAKLPILQQHPGLHILIAGNCDDRGSDEYNLALGQARAAAAKRYLVDHGIAADRIEIVTYGKERPIAVGDDAASRAQDRNDEFFVLAGADELQVGAH
ncbi:MAG TPA: OmpA family protein [Gemmatimonadaceae bacterium]|nr:OmpA family protein [Gemmatimonadaceae bacterium]